MKRLTRRCKQALNDEMTKFKKFIEKIWRCDCEKY